VMPNSTCSRGARRRPGRTLRAWPGVGRRGHHRLVRRGVEAVVRGWNQGDVADSHLAARIGDSLGPGSVNMPPWLWRPLLHLLALGEPVTTADLAQAT